MKLYKKILGGKLPSPEEIEFLSHKNKEFNLEEAVIVMPNDVIFVLNKYLRGEMKDVDILEWAKILLFFENIYVSIGWNDDMIADQYEQMWYVLQQLSSPEIDGKITPEKILEHLRVLDQLKKQV